MNFTNFTLKSIILLSLLSSTVLASQFCNINHVEKYYKMKNHQKVYIIDDRSESDKIHLQDKYHAVLSSGQIITLYRDNFILERAATSEVIDLKVVIKLIDHPVAYKTGKVTSVRVSNKANNGTIFEIVGKEMIYKYYGHSHSKKGNEQNWKNTISIACNDPFWSIVKKTVEENNPEIYKN